MPHALPWLMSAYLGIGVLLLHVGPLHRLLVDAMQEARMRRAMQPPHEPPLPPPLLSALVLGVATLLLWPCLWPTAVCRQGLLQRHFPGLGAARPTPGA